MRKIVALAAITFLAVSTVDQVALGQEGIRIQERTYSVPPGPIGYTCIFGAFKIDVANKTSVGTAIFSGGTPVNHYYEGLKPVYYGFGLINAYNPDHSAILAYTGDIFSTTIKLPTGENIKYYLLFTEVYPGQARVVVLREKATVGHAEPAYTGQPAG